VPRNEKRTVAVIAGATLSVPVKPPCVGVMVWSTAVSLVTLTVPPQLTVIELGENAKLTPLFTIASDVDEELFGQAVAAVEVGFGVGFALVFVAVGWLVAVVRDTGGALVAARVGVVLARTAVRDGFAEARAEADGGALDAVSVAIGLGEEFASRAGPPLPPLQAVSVSTQRARLIDRRRPDISPCTQRKTVRFSRR
jgi:hypothetical protein